MFGIRRHLPGCGVELVALGLAGAGLCAAPAAASERCPRLAPPTVTIKREQAPLVYDFAEKSPQLTVRLRKNDTAAGSPNESAYGLAHVRLSYDYQYSFSYVTASDGAVCAGVTSVEGSFGFSERRVFIAGELPAGTCIHREVMGHEMQHVAVDDRLLDEVMPSLRRRIADTVNRIGMVRARSLEAAKQTLRGHIDGTFKAAYDEFWGRRKRAQAQVDTQAEYRRIGRSCNGEMQRYARSAAQAR